METIKPEEAHDFHGRYVNVQFKATKIERFIRVKTESNDFYLVLTENAIKRNPRFWENPQACLDETFQVNGEIRQFPRPVMKSRYRIVVHRDKIQQYSAPKNKSKYNKSAFSNKDKIVKSHASSKQPGPNTSAGCHYCSQCKKSVTPLKDRWRGKTILRCPNCFLTLGQVS